MKQANQRAHRSDIDALRALAVGFVVLFHMSFPGFESGFVGVDIFFVLSGFLITGVLARELEATGSIDLLNFWSRRIRRLLPAGLVVVGSVLVFSRLFGSPLSWSQTSGTATSAILYYSNYYFVSQASDYFGSNTETNPLLHFWSLSVEEQYYLVWPLLFGTIGLAAARSKRIQRRSLQLSLISTVIVASFVHSYILSASDSASSYYLTTSRAWEFAVGALLAVYFQNKPNQSPVGVRSMAAVVGLGMLAMSLVAIDLAPFPAPSGVLPVAGTALFVWAAVPKDSPFGVLLGNPVIQYVGRLSYSWYLWHWPFLVLGQQYLLSGSAKTRVLLVVASFGASVVTHHGVENPLRYSSLIKSRGRSYAFAAGSIVIGVGGALLLSMVAEQKLAEPELAALQELRDPWYSGVTEDFACAISDVDGLQEECTFGSVEAPKRLLLLGDSNAGHWLPAFHLLGLEHDFAVTVRIRGGCPAPAINARGTIDPQECAALQAETAQMVERLDPDVIIISQTGKYAELTLDSSGGALSEAERQDLWITKTRELVDGISDWNIGWITPIASLDFDPVECLSMRSAEDCENPAWKATANAVRQGDWTRSAFEQTTVKPTLFDPLPFLCTETDCPLVVDDTYVYLDDNHLSAPMVEQLTPEIEAFLQRVSFLP